MKNNYYYQNQLERLKLNKTYAHQIQIVDSEGNKTNYLDLNKQSIPILIKYLKKLVK